MIGATAEPPPVSLQEPVAGDSKVAEKQPSEREPQGWKCVLYIIGNETFENISSNGLAANLIVYLVNVFHMDGFEATNVVNIFNGTTNFAPLVGAFISDAYFGRFYTIAFSSIASFSGMLMLTLTASLSQLHPPKCPAGDQSQEPPHCPSPSSTNLAALYFSMVLLIIGAAGIRPCSLPFGADQFDSSTDHGRQSLNSFFNWYYFSASFAYLLSVSVMVYIQDSFSWPIGFGIPTALMFLGIVLFFLGTHLYVHVAPGGSVFSGIAQVLIAAIRKRRLPLPEAKILYNAAIANLPLTPKFRWLNKAAISLAGEVNPEDGSRLKPWRLSGVQQVEEVKCLIKIVPFWLSGVLCYVALTQQWTFAVLQAMEMDLRIGSRFSVPPGSVGTLVFLGLTLFLPIYDRVLVPVARRFTKLEQGITLLQRQGTGLVVSVVSMVVAAEVERRRREAGKAMSVMWLTPQLIMMGVSEAFIAVGQIEFFNKEFPENMLTVAGSMFFCSQAVASYLSSFFVTVVRRATGGEGRRSWLEDDLNQGRLDYFYYLIAAVGALNFIFFWFCARFYQYKRPMAKVED